MKELLLYNIRELFDPIKYFFQRRIRGFDDREVFDLETSLYKWLIPRLERYSKVSYKIYSVRDDNEDLDEVVWDAIRSMKAILKMEEESIGFLIGLGEQYKIKDKCLKDIKKLYEKLPSLLW